MCDACCLLRSEWFALTGSDAKLGCWAWVEFLMGLKFELNTRFTKICIFIVQKLIINSKHIKFCDKNVIFDWKWVKNGKAKYSINNLNNRLTYSASQKKTDTKFSLYKFLCIERCVTILWDSKFCEIIDFTACKEAKP